MQIISVQESLDAGPVSDASRFNGGAGMRMLFATEAAHVGRAFLVQFEPGARNHWHAHSGGQLLHVVEGECWIQSRDDEARKIGSGESAVFAPGEQHWHGASARGPMRHLAVTMGETTWFAASPDPE
jgi:quercetin dioxygenase-like cupin family protein